MRRGTPAQWILGDMNLQLLADDLADLGFSGTGAARIFSTNVSPSQWQNDDVTISAGWATLILETAHAASNSAIARAAIWPSTRPPILIRFIASTSSPTLLHICAIDPGTTL